MSDSNKLSGSLRALVEKVAAVDSSFEVDVVVTPAKAERTDSVAASIEALGVKVDLQADRLQCALPLREVSDLSKLESVASIRLVRRHRIQSKA